MSDFFPITQELIDTDHPHRQLYNMIKLCVAVDVIFNNPKDLSKITPYSELSVVDRVRFDKQTRRLFEVCSVHSESAAYIHDRYNYFFNMTEDLDNEDSK